MSKSIPSSIGDPMYVESLLSDSEYKECARKYPSTYYNGSEKPKFFDSKEKWRFNMGKNLSSTEIRIINLRWDYIIHQSKIKP